MRVIITARHMNLTTPLREHAEEKLGRSLMKVFDKPAAKIEIELVDLGEMKDKQSKECRVSVFMPRGVQSTLQRSMMTCTKPSTSHETGSSSRSNENVVASVTRVETARMQPESDWKQPFIH